MWISSIDCTYLKTFLVSSHIPILVSKLDGTILWANNSFCEWSKYSLYELQQLGWKKLSYQDENLDADLEQVKLLNEYNLSYTLRKQYIPKGEKPAWGTLTVMRFPASGELQFCICTWEPFQNGTATALSTVMEHNEELKDTLVTIKTAIQELSNYSAEDKWIMSTVEMARKHPKISISFFVIAMSVLGFNNVVQALQNLHVLPPAVKVEVQQQRESNGNRN